jgi:hypothetical protein
MQKYQDTNWYDGGASRLSGLEGLRTAFNNNVLDVYFSENGGMELENAFGARRVLKRKSINKHV